MFQGVRLANTLSKVIPVLQAWSVYGCIFVDFRFFAHMNCKEGVGRRHLKCVKRGPMMWVCSYECVAMCQICV